MILEGSLHTDDFQGDDLKELKAPGYNRSGGRFDPQTGEAIFTFGPVPEDRWPAVRFICVWLDGHLVRKAAIEEPDGQPTLGMVLERGDEYQFCIEI